ncbi:ABC transporter substrate-binding protein [Nesterenkonia flava]|uniref:ABC transporter substrate-binding protein n=1 Tax=Nesterenkonia flava TaxID=469799 RepID=A0ABU1FQX0_9MICC|nr:ABC transporter substrate-binding protein [Nesterenkonia flava]MDR5710576.1 ABC transporter substrate-binding protein [Nesterenkonia flava]
MKKTARKTLSAAAVAALIITACGETQGDDDGDRIFISSTGTLPMLNPQFVTSPAVQQVGSSMLEPLVRITDEFEVVPWLAHDWTVSDDGLEVTFHLEEGVQWHDGEPFTAADVKFNFEEIMPLDSLGADFVGTIESVETPDDYTVVLRLSEPYGALLESLSLQFLLPRHVYEGTEYLENPANNAPVGTGPLVFEEFVDADRVEARGNDNYWKGEVQVDRVIFPIMTDPNASDLAMLSGEIDQRGGIVATRVEEFQAHPDIELTLRGNLPQQVVLMFNADSEELAGPEVRRLVYSAIDKNQVVDTALPETSTVPEGVFPESLGWARSPHVNFTEDFAYDVEEINRRFDELGLTAGGDGYRFSVDVHYMSPLADAAAVAEVMQSTLAEVGIRVELIGLETNVYTEKVYEQRDFDTAIQIATLSTDPSLGITRWYTCNPEKVAARNPSGVCDEEIDDAARRAILTPGQEERGQHLQRFEEAAAEAMIAAPIVFVSQINAYNTANWEGHDFASGLNGQDWTLLKPVED